MSLKRGFAVLCIAAMALGPLACVDVPSTGPQLPDYRSTFRFVYAANDANPGQVEVDNASVGNLTVGQATAYLDLRAGDRLLSLAGQDKVTKSFETDRRGTVIVFTKATGAASVRSYLLANERYSYETYAGTVPAGRAYVRFANGVSDGTTSQAVTVRRDSSGTLFPVVANVAFGAVSAYANLSAGAHNLVITRAGATDTLRTSINVAAKTRHTSLVFGAPGSAASFSNFQEQ